MKILVEILVGEVGVGDCQFFAEVVPEGVESEEVVWRDAG